MFDRMRAQAVRSQASRRRGLRPGLLGLEGRQLLATLISPPAVVSSPQHIGLQVPLNGGTGDNQTYTVSSDNPSVGAAIAQGQFLTINVTHASSGPSDPAFSGSMTFQLFDDLTPLTTSKIEALVTSGFYNGKNFHRIANNFPGPNDYIVQGGSVNGNGTGDPPGPGFPFQDEFVQQLAFTGTGQLAMANAGPDTNGSQFFITTGSPRFLDYKHTIFGQLVSGQDVLNEMTKVTTNSTTPVTPILISTATLSPVNPNGVIHVDTTQAVAGQTANLTVTATDPTNNTTTSSVIKVNVTADDSTYNARAVLLPMSTTQTVGLNQADVFKLYAFDAEPTDVLTYTVQGGTTTNPSTGATTFVPVDSTKATATVDQTTGIVTVTPVAGFTGTISLLVGVRDQVNRAGTGTNAPPIDTPSNFDTNKITLTVTSGGQVNLTPIAVAQTANVVINSPSTVQLVGNTANPGSSQTLTYNLLSPPQHGTITNFNAQNGTFTYTPGADFIGTDRVSFNVNDVGDPTPNLTSPTAVETISVTGGDTASIRVISNVLVVTPPPRTDRGTNTIVISQVNGNVQVRVNNIIDVNSPAASSLDRVVVYGSKANDVISVDPSVSLPVTLDGGHGGKNALQAGTGAARLHGWFGQNTLTGGPTDDALIGRAGHVKFRKSGGLDLLFAAKTRHNAYPNQLFKSSRRANNLPPDGTFYRFVGNHLVRVAPPAPQRNTRTIN